jgi:hypothetical protein
VPPVRSARALESRQRLPTRGCTRQPRSPGGHDSRRPASSPRAG